MLYNNTTGAWLNVNDDLQGKNIKIINECVQTPSDKFKNEDGTPKQTNLVKVRVQGAEESVNMRPNWTSIGALRDAFGQDSKNWIGKILVAHVKDATTGQSVYLVPEGFELYRNKEKRWAIRKIAGEPTIEPEEKAPRGAPAREEIEYPQEEINPEDIPF